MRQKLFCRQKQKMELRERERESERERARERERERESNECDLQCKGLSRGEREMEFVQKTEIEIVCN